MAKQQSQEMSYYRSCYKYKTKRIVKKYFLNIVRKKRKLSQLDWTLNRKSFFTSHIRIVFTRNNHVLIYYTRKFLINFYRIPRFKLGTYNKSIFRNFASEKQRCLLHLYTSRKLRRNKQITSELKQN